MIPPLRLLTVFALGLGASGATAVAADVTPPSVPAGLAASAITVTGFTLTWAASTDNVGVTAYQVYRNGASLGTTAGLTWNVSGLVPNTAYTMTVRARDAAGNWSAQSAPLSIATLADTTAPSIPDGLAGSVITVTSFTLAWNAATDDVKVTGYEVFRNGISLGTSTALSRNLTALTPGTDYVMTVRARDAAGNWSVPSAPLTVSTPPDVLPPSVPGGLGTSVIGVTSFTLTWAAAADNVKVTGYEVFRDGVSLGTSAALSRAISALTPNTAYAMTVRARDAAGNWSDFSAPFTVTTLPDVTPPSVPIGLASSSITASSFTLRWTAAADNVKVTGYDVQRDGTTTLSAATPSLSITGLGPATAYAMTVRARDAAGNVSDWSAPLTVTTIKATSVAPTITSPTTSVYGNSYTATATGSAGTGALIWALGIGSTAANSAIDASTGEVTVSSSGRVVIKVQRAGDDHYNPSPFSANFTITFATRPITLTLGGSKPYDATTASTGASAAITAGTLAAGDSIDFVYKATTSATAGTYLKLETPTISNAVAPLVRTTSYLITYAGSYIITKATQSAPTVTSAASATYGTAYTATATGGSGTGKLAWALGSGSTADGAAINAGTGVITAKSAGLVVINVLRAGDANYSASPASPDFTVTVGPRPITVTLGGSKIYNGTTVATGATATRTLGTLAAGDVLTTGFGPTASADVGSYTGLATSTVANLSAPTDRTASYAITYAGSYLINPATQVAPIISSPTTGVYGTPYTATASGGLGTGALIWSLGIGSTAPGAAIDATTGAVTTNGTGKVYIRVQRAADTNYKLSPLSANFLITFAVRPITVTLGGGKPFDGTKAPTGATATITVGDLAPGDTIDYVFANTPSAAIGNYSNLTTATISNAALPLVRTSYYAITYNGTYAIGQIPVTFSLSATAFTYTGSPQGPTVIASPAGATFTTGGTLSATAVGTYTATATATGPTYTGSNNNLVWTITAVVVPPPVPADVTSSDITSTGFTVSWTSGGSGVGTYEVFVNGVSQGTTTQTTMTVTGLNPGTSYTVTVRSHGPGGTSDPSPPVIVMYTGVPFIANFEPDEGYHLGALQGQNGWVVTGSANIVTTPVYAGTQALSIPPAAVASFTTRAFSGSNPAVTFIDVFALPAAAPSPDAGVILETDVVEVALTGSAGQGVIQAYNGDGVGGGTWVSTGVGPVLDASGQATAWGRFTIRCDYTAQRWDLYFNGNLVRANLGFINNTAPALSALILGGHSLATTGFDELFVSFDNPLFADADKDGMDDAWETAHGLNPAVNDRNLDPDGDGQTNIQEYLHGTDPQVFDNPSGGTGGGAAKLAAGSDQSVFIDAGGIARAWGRNESGQLGDGTATDRAQMMRVTSLPGLLASTTAGESHGLAVTLTGQVYAWGDNEFGQLGDGTRTVRRTPVAVSGLQHVVQVAAGDHHSLALLADGTVWAWGANQLGQLGDGTYQDQPLPEHISGLPTIVSIEVGANHSAALDATGHVWTWGSNAFGQLGDGTIGGRSAPAMVPGLSQVVALAAGRQHLLALMTDGTVKAWGANEAGQLGSGTTTGTGTPATISGLSGIKSLAAGGSHSLALSSSGVLWVWGANDAGQLGNGLAVDSPVPVSLALTGVSDLAAGRDHVIVRKTDGTLWAWGSNHYGQLGNSTTGSFSNTPVAVTPPVD